jgi:peptide/nickel transport system permease protein
VARPPRRRRLGRDLPAVIALVVLTLIVLTAIFADQVAPHDPAAQELNRRLLPPFWQEAGSPDFLLGSDKLGRDVLSRMIHGARVPLILGFVASLGSLTLGAVLGVIAGYFGRAIGDVIMRVAEAQLAFPFLVAAVAVIAVVGPGFVSLVALLSVWSWAIFAKVIRAEVLSVKEKEYIEAARSVGAGAPRILLTHILPNVLSPLIVLWTFQVAVIIQIEAALSYIGLGVQPPTPAWGSMLSDGRELIESAWWLSTFPGVAIVLTVLSVNILGDALRDRLDPRLLRSQ